MDQFHQFIEIVTSKGVFTTLLILFVAIICRWTTRRFIIKNDALSPTLKTRWGKLAQNLIIFFTLLALVLEWAPQLRTFALSLTAVAVAIVIAFKEIILCFTGAIMRTSSSVKVGDIVEIQGSRGRALELTLLSTIIAQLNDDDQPTGKKITLPNSVFLSSSFACSKSNVPLAPLNLTFTLEPDYALARHVRERVYHTMQSLQSELAAAGDEAHQSSSGYLDERNLEPELKVYTAADAKVCFKVYFVCAPDEKERITTAIRNAFFDSAVSYSKTLSS